MALLGSAAMLLWYDIVPEQIAEHDEWHTRQHFPERVGIPGFLRAQRWVAASPGPRYFVVYEVADVGILSSAPYVDRLNDPTEWTRRLMPHFRGMVRGFCALETAQGTVLGANAVVLRYAAASGGEAPLRSWLQGELIPDVARRPGIASAHTLRSDRAPEMTAEQRIRGRDGSVDRVLLITGYSSLVVAGLAHGELGAQTLVAHGAAPGAIVGTYQLDCLSVAA